MIDIFSNADILPCMCNLHARRRHVILRNTMLPDKSRLPVIQQARTFGLSLTKSTKTKI